MCRLGGRHLYADLPRTRTTAGTAHGTAGQMRQMEGRQAVIHSIIIFIGGMLFGIGSFVVVLALVSMNGDDKGET